MRALLTPRMLGAHLLALVLVAVALGLATWQVLAWDARRTAEARDLTRLEPISLAEAIGPDDPFPGDRVGQPVVLEGDWLPGETVFVEGRESDGRSGSWVVTPLVDDASGSALPVVRGWTPDPGQAPPAPAGRARLVAYLQPAEGRTVTDPDPRDDVLPQLRTADLTQRVEQDLFGAYAVVPPPDAGAVAPGDWPHADAATNDGSAGLEPATLDQLPPAGRFTALRNLLYGIEWVVFGGFAVFIWWQHVRDVRRREREEPAPAPHPVGSGT